MYPIITNFNRKTTTRVPPILKDKHAQLRSKTVPKATNKKGQVWRKAQNILLFPNIFQHHPTSFGPVRDQFNPSDAPGVANELRGDAWWLECQSLQMPIWTQNHWRIGKSAFKNMAIKRAGIYGCSSPNMVYQVLNHPHMENEQTNWE